MVDYSKLREIGYSARDLTRAHQFKEEERINPLTKENMFIGAIYCILSLSQDFVRQWITYQKVLREGLITPKRILEKSTQLEKTLQGVRYPNQTNKKLTNFSLWYTASPVLDDILSDIKQGRECGYNLRKKLITAPSFGYKCASLFLEMCGYDYLATIDRWVERFLQEDKTTSFLKKYSALDIITTIVKEVETEEDLEFNLKTGFHKKGGRKKERGIPNSQYIKLEKRMQAIAELCGISPADLHRMIWITSSVSQGNVNRNNHQVEISLE